MVLRSFLALLRGEGASACWVPSSLIWVKESESSLDRRRFVVWESKPYTMNSFAPRHGTQWRKIWCRNPFRWFPLAKQLTRKSEGRFLTLAGLQLVLKLPLFSVYSAEETCCPPKAAAQIRGQPPGNGVYLWVSTPRTASTVGWGRVRLRLGGQDDRPKVGTRRRGRQKKTNHKSLLQRQSVCPLAIAKAQVTTWWALKRHLMGRSFT